MATSTVSYANTPQAKDDAAAAREDAILSIDVMGNDLGGAAKKLYSVNQANLLVAQSTGVSTLGAKIAIVNGKISYDTSGAAKIQALADGQTATDTFTYAIQLGNGTISTATVTVKVTGTNDAPVLASDGVAVHAMEEIADVTGGTGRQTASATLAFTDADQDDTHTVSCAAPSVTWSNSGGTLPAGVAVVLAGALTLTKTDSTGTGSGSVKADFALADTLVDFLAAGETLTATYTVAVIDGHGGVSTQPVTFTITGTNDAPVVTGTATGTVTELAAPAGTLSATGTLGFTDADPKDAHTVTAVAVGTTLGTLSPVKTADTTGSGTGGAIGWTYNVDAAKLESLAAGETKVESFTITLNDGNGGKVAKQIDVTLTGTNDAPAITAEAGDSAGTASPLVETDAGLITSGTLTVRDADLRDTVTVAAVEATATGIVSPALTQQALLGFFTVSAGPVAADPSDAHNITWSFASDKQAFDYLAADETVTLTYRLRPDDGSAPAGTGDGVVTIRITGTNDAPVIAALDGSPDSAGTATALTNDAALTATGALTVVDVDASDTVTASVLSVDTGETANPGGLTTAQLLSFLTLHPTGAPAGTTAYTHDGTAGTLTWRFDAGSERFSFLKPGEELTLRYTLRPDDGHADSNSGDGVVTIRIVGAAGTGPTIDALPAGNDPTPALGGTAAPGSTVLVYADGGETPIATGYADSAGRWTASIADADALDDGPHSFTATATDASGVVSPLSAPVSTLIDTQTTLSLDPPPLVTRETSLVLHGTAEVGGTVAIYVDGGTNPVATTVPAADGTWSYKVQGPLSDGVHLFKAVVTDAVGNTMASPDVSVTIGAGGYVVDGYIRGATVFADANGNGVLDAGEVSGTTDASGYYSLPGGKGAVVVVGGTGTDVSTGLKVEATLTAPEGYAIVSPLTTLVQALTKIENPATPGQTFTVAEATGTVLQAFGLATPTDLATTDPVSSIYTGSPALFVAGVNVLNTVAVIAAAVEGAGASATTATQSAFDALAQSLVGPAGNGTPSLTDAADVTQIAKAAGTQASVALSDAAANATGAVAATLNTEVIERTAAAASTSALAQSVSAVQIVAHGTASDDLQAAVSSGTALDAVVQGYQGASLDTKVADAIQKVGSIAAVAQASITLTKGADILTASALNTTVKGTAQTLDAHDKLDGGGGYDVLALFGANAVNLNTPATLTGFEEVQAKYVGGSGPSSITLRDGEATRLSLTGEFGYSVGVQLGADAAQAVKVAPGAYLNFIRVTASTGAANIDMTGVNGDSANFILSSGDAVVHGGAFNYSYYSLSDGKATVYTNGTANMYDSTYSVIALGQGVYDLHGGQGDDTFVLNDASVLARASVIDGGDGSFTGWAGTSHSTDTVQFNGSGSLYDLTNAAAQIKGIEAFSVSNSTVKVDDATFAGVTTVYGNGTLTTGAASLDLRGKSVAVTVASTHDDGATHEGTTFLVDDAQTAVHVVGGSGTDTVVADTLTLTADQRDAIFAQGSVEVIRDQTGVYGNDDANVLKAIPNDFMAGGGGADTFVFAPSFGQSTIADFTPGTDHVQFHFDLFQGGAATILDGAHAQQFNGDVVIKDDFGDQLLLKNVQLDDLRQHHATDFTLHA